MVEEDRYRALAEKIFMGNSTLIPLLFEMIADPEEAEILLALPATAKGLAESYGKSEEEAQGILDVLFRKGLVFKKQTPDGTLYRTCRDLMQFHDASILWPEAPREYLDLWQRFMEEEWPAFSEIVDKILPKPVARIVPVGETVEGRQQILAYEDVRQLIEEAGTIAVTNCTCRLTAQKCDRPVEICLQIGKAGEYTIDRGSGRKIDKEEAMALLRKAEEAGLIHTTMNRAEDTHFICNCCEDCCMTFPLLINKKLHLCDPSRFVARIDEGLCNGCGDCLERCYFGAMAMEDERNIVVITEDECMGCGLCEVVCKEGAISLEIVREEDFIPT